MNLSYWEKNTWFSNVDFCIVGSGIVGLSCAIQLRLKHPNSKIVVLERGTLPNGASTKNAGFACFGSMSEILSDLKTHSETEVFDLVLERYEGLKLLRETLGDKAIDYKNNGGYEIFLKQDKDLYEECHSRMKDVNEFLKPIFRNEVFRTSGNQFNFKNTLQKIILHSFEGQLDVGKMMQSLLKKAQSMGVMILNGINVESFEVQSQKVMVKLKDLEFYTKHLFIATNAFSKKLIDVELFPARNQVIITEPIKDLEVKGTFHLNEGYYYFRNVGQRILLGGGRHLSKREETTEVFSTTQKIQLALEEILYDVILNRKDIEIEQRWSGILGVGSKKKPILKSLSARVHCAVRLGGMGVAIGSSVGRKLADLLE